MAVWALADLHLSFGTPGKEMDVFGEKWKDHPQKIEAHWNEVVKEEDLVLIPGDISWALHLEGAIADLIWIDRLPGTKVMIRGNHDYWWSALSKLREILPPSIHVIQNDAFLWKGIAVGGSRLWDSYEYDFDNYVDMFDNPVAKPLTERDVDEERREKIFRRELMRLENSLKRLDPSAKTRIAMTHYPPIGMDLNPSQASELLEKYKVEACAFGHLHNMRHGLDHLFGQARGVRYIFSAADFLDFKPIRIC